MGISAVKRTLPYVVVAVAGFALAYIIIYILLDRGSPANVAHDILASDSNAVVNPVSPPPPPVDTTSPDTGVAVLPVTAPNPVYVRVPDLVNMSIDDARAILASLHLGVVVRRDTSSIRPPDTVLQQTPSAGQSVLTNSSVTLTTSMFPPLSGDTSSNPLR